uniref:Uncharacterized protein n=1 Tax=Knipowitschia caucasica TaxID=637954 RepID=A0AAV2JAJ5_KNICA
MRESVWHVEYVRMKTRPFAVRYVQLNSLSQSSGLAPAKRAVSGMGTDVAANAVTVVCQSLSAVIGLAPSSTGGWSFMGVHLVAFSVSGQ